MFRKLIGGLVGVVLLAISPNHAYATILYGGFTFDDLAFADDATQLDVGTISTFGTAADLDDALVGFSPNKGIFNTGFGGNANLFQLDFIDFVARNDAGTDLVFFETRFSQDPYSIAVREVGGSFTAFLNFAASDFVSLGLTGALSGNVFALSIDLDAFGLAPGTLVDAMQFASLPIAGGDEEGDPLMAGVLNGTVPVPEPGTLTLFVIGLAGLGFLRRRRKLT